MFHVTMSLSHKIESSHQKPLLLPLPAFAQQVFSQQSRLSSIQRRRYLLPLLPSLFRLTQDKVYRELDEIIVDYIPHLQQTEKTAVKTKINYFEVNKI